MGRAASGAIIEKASAITKRIRFTLTPVSYFKRRAPARRISFGSIQRRESRPPLQLNNQKTIYHKDSASQNAPFMLVLLRPGYGFGSLWVSLFNGKRFDVERERMDATEKMDAAKGKML